MHDFVKLQTLSQESAIKQIRGDNSSTFVTCDALINCFHYRCYNVVTKTSAFRITGFKGRHCRQFSINDYITVYATIPERFLTAPYTLNDTCKLITTHNVLHAALCMQI